VQSVLMISYSYPPMGNPGALRAAKFAKYLPEFGWHPVVVTPRAGYSPMPRGMEDHVEMPGVHVVRTGDFGGIKRATVAIGGSRIAGPRKSRLANSLLLPDRDITWYPFAYRAASHWIRRHQIDAIYSTSPTMTNHLVAQRLARRYRLPWVADFRDPWTLSNRYANRGLRRRWEQRIENSIIHNADRICMVSDTMVKMYAEAFPEARNKLILVRNGFDDADFANLPRADRDGRFVLLHSGTLDGTYRNPAVLLQAIAALKQKNFINSKTFCFRVAGKVGPTVMHEASILGLSDMVDFVGIQPHRESLLLMTTAAALVLIELLPENMTTKFYEYLAAHKPILAMLPSNIELAQLTRQLGVGTVVDPGDVVATTNWLVREIEVFRRHGPTVAINANSASAFSRREQTRILATLLGELNAEEHAGR
jgi:glycosyltransferase involved in cell wall biosynthesis